MAVTVQVGALIGFRDAPPVDNDALGVILSDRPDALSKVWGLVLLLALRDRATSVHYHPWREDGGLAYVLSGVRYAFQQPFPAHLSGR